MCPTLCSEDAGSPERPTGVSSPQKTPSRPNRALQQSALVRSATPLHRLKEDKLFLPIHCYDLNHRLPGKPRRQMKPEGGILLKQALSVCRWPWRTPCPLPAPSVPGDCGASQTSGLLLEEIRHQDFWVSRTCRLQSAAGAAGAADAAGEMGRQPRLESP